MDDDDDDDDGGGSDISTDDSELNLLKNEAFEFVENATNKKKRPAKKKARLNLHDSEL